MSIFTDAWDTASGVWEDTGGKVVDGLFGTDPNKAWDKSNFHATNWAENPNYDPNAFSYGGQGAQHAEFLARQQGELDSYMRSRGEQAQGRTMNENGQLVGQEGMGRGQMQDAIGMQRSIAMGTGPSQARAVLQQGVNQAQAAGSAQAGGARGAAALALGQGNAQANTANAIQNAGGEAARIKAQEQLQGAGMYGSLSRDQRGMDINRIGQRNQMDMFNRQTNDAYDIQHQQLAQQRAQLAHQQRTAQMQGATGQQQLLANSDAQKQGMNMGVNMYNTNAVRDRKNMIGGMIGGVAQMGMGMGGGGGGMGQMAQQASGSGMGASKFDPGY